MAHDSKEMFWVVWREGGGSPTFRHPSRRGACDEAKRLAATNAGQTFIVLQSEVGFRTPELVQEIAYDDIPF